MNTWVNGVNESGHDMMQLAPRNLVGILRLLLIRGLHQPLQEDMGLAEFGRKELNLAEHEMPGLMNTRKLLYFD